VGAELNSVEEAKLELGDGVCERMEDVVLPLLEEEPSRVGELVEEVASADEEEVVTGVVVEVSDEAVLELVETVLVPLEPLECLSRALCKTSPRPRALTALSMDCSTLSFAQCR